MRGGDMKKINIMCDHYDNIDWKFTDPDGNSLLHNIGRHVKYTDTEYDFHKKVYFLLDKGVDINQKNNIGQTAYEYIKEESLRLLDRRPEIFKPEIVSAMNLINPNRVGQTGGKYKWKKKTYVVKTGDRGGKYIIVNKKKKYVPV